MSTRIRTLTASLLCLSLFAISSVHYIYAQTMTSSTYKIQSDSLNFGGGRGTSTSFSIEDTAGEVGTGESQSTLYKVAAGYQQMQAIYLSVTAAADVTMSPSIGGVTGGTSNGSTNFTVTTDNPAGYTVTLTASGSPAMQSATSNIADYTPAGANPDFAFAIAATDSEFAFSPEGTDIVQRFKDNGASCNIGSGDTSDACWAPLTTSAQTIVTRTTPNQTTGTMTTLKFRVQSGSSHVQEPGTYVATTTITVLPL